MSPAARPQWQQATALITLGAGGVVTGLSFVPNAPADLTSPASLPIKLMALEHAATAAPGSDAMLRAAIVHTARHFLRLAETRSPAEMEALIWRHASTDGADHGPSCAAFASLMLELGSHMAGLPSWVNGGATYPWPVHSWVDGRVDPNPASPGVVSVLQDAQAHGRWHALGDAYIPQAGDWVLFDGHVEVVTAYAGGVLHTIGGDSGPNLSVNAHEYPAPLGGQGVAGFVDNGVGMSNSGTAGGGTAGTGGGAANGGAATGGAATGGAATGGAATGGAATGGAAANGGAANGSAAASGSAAANGGGAVASGTSTGTDQATSPGGAASPGAAASPRTGTGPAAAAGPVTTADATTPQRVLEPRAIPVPRTVPQSRYAPQIRALPAPGAQPAEPGEHGSGIVPAPGPGQPARTVFEPQPVHRRVPQIPPDRAGGTQHRPRPHHPRRSHAATADVPATGLRRGPRHAPPGEAAIPGLFRAPHRHHPGDAGALAPYHRIDLPPDTATTPGTAAQQAFINEVARGAMATQIKYGVPASVTIAQAIDESGWGQSILATNDHNLFGIKGTGPAGSDQQPTQEYINGQLVNTSASFRIYHNVGQSIDAHARLLSRGSDYATAMSQKRNPDAFAQALTGVYATDPGYGAKLVQLMKHFDLYRYDRAAARAEAIARGATAAGPAGRGGTATSGDPASTGGAAHGGLGRAGIPEPHGPGRRVGHQPQPGSRPLHPVRPHQAGGGPHPARSPLPPAAVPPQFSPGPDQRPGVPNPAAAANPARAPQPGPAAARSHPAHPDPAANPAATPYPGRSARPGPLAHPARPAGRPAAADTSHGSAPRQVTGMATGSADAAISGIPGIGAHHSAAPHTATPDAPGIQAPGPHAATPHGTAHANPNAHAPVPPADAASFATKANPSGPRAAAAPGPVAPAPAAAATGGAAIPGIPHRAQGAHQDQMHHTAPAGPGAVAPTASSAGSSIPGVPARQAARGSRPGAPAGRAPASSATPPGAAERAPAPGREASTAPGPVSMPATASSPAGSWAQVPGTTARASGAQRAAKVLPAAKPAPAGAIASASGRAPARGAAGGASGTQPAAWANRGPSAAKPAPAGAIPSASGRSPARGAAAGASGTQPAAWANRGPSVGGAAPTSAIPVASVPAPRSRNEVSPAPEPATPPGLARASWSETPAAVAQASRTASPAGPGPGSGRAIPAGITQAPGGASASAGNPVPVPASPESASASGSAPGGAAVPGLGNGPAAAAPAAPGGRGPSAADSGAPAIGGRGPSASPGHSGPASGRRPVAGATLTAYHAHMPPSVREAFVTSAKMPLTRAEPLYLDVASHTGIRWEILAACDWMQCKARQGYSPVYGEKLGTLNPDDSCYRTRSAALEQCADDLVHLARSVYRLDIATGRELSVRDLAKVFAAFRWGGLLLQHNTSAMDFPYAVAGLTADHTHMRWPNIDEPNAPDKPGSRFRQPFGAVPIVLGLHYQALM